ncbi:MAG: deoxynucleoside kinase [Anaerolineales bacterium]|nr:deoxynucleoside kinase [Anaerolineales bacterium]
MTKYFITIAGNIGVGKSTLVKLLSDRAGWDPIYEAVTENPYLADFYEDMRRWSFHSQVFFLARRLQQHHALLQNPNSVIQDRSVYEDAEIFARNLYAAGNMSERDWQSYLDLYNTLTTMLKPPDLVVYLKASVPTIERRITQRGRTYEQTIATEYLQKINQLYDNWVAAFTLSPVLIVDTNNLNYVLHKDHLEQIWRRIDDRLQGKETISFEA